MAQDPFALFNEMIADIQIPTDEMPDHKCIFICGAPRSGTTILMQSLSYVGDLGYINNIVARFASNPALGALLSNSLSIPKEFTGRSNFGATEGLSEPHEFGLGWANLLGINELEQPTKNWELPKDSAAKIESIANSFELPVIFKSFAYIWVIKELSNQLKNSIWIKVTRDETANAKSLEKLYNARAKDRVPPEWTSFVMNKTKERASSLDLETRCKAQIEDINEYLERSFSQLKPVQKIEVTLEQYQSDPISVTQSIIETLEVEYSSARLKEIVK